MENKEKKVIDTPSALQHFKFIFKNLDILYTQAATNNLISPETSNRLKNALNEFRLCGQKLTGSTKLLLFDNIFYKCFLSQKKYKVTGYNTIATGKEVLASIVWYTLGYGDIKFNEERQTNPWSIKQLLLNLHQFYKGEKYIFRMSV